MGSSNRFFKNESIFFSVLFIIVLVLGVWAGKSAYDLYHSDELSSLVTRAQTIALFVQPEELATLSVSPDDEFDPTYQKIKQTLMMVRGYYKDTRFVYINVLKGNKILFIGDSEEASSTDSSPPGQEYIEAPQGLREALTVGGVHVTGPYKDRWGSWISAFVPIYDEHRTIVASVGIDIDAKYHFDLVYRSIIVTSLITLFLLLVIVMVYYLRKKERQIISIKSDFIALASHELRTPLTEVNWQVSALLSDPSLGEKALQGLKDIKSATARLVTMTSSILETTAAEHDVIKKTHFQSVDIGKVLLASLVAVGPAKELKRITINLPTEIEKPLMILGEAEKLELAFTNLLSNAIKYSPEKSSIDVVFQDTKNAHINVSITDHGMGIPKNEINQIFNGFFRAKNALTSGVRGSGFGLYMTKKIVELYGGKITCSSDLGKGTTFTIFLVKAN